jgi:hypothetical protein
MKTFFFVIIAAFMFPAHAHHTQNHEDLPSFESCESVGAMALLNKDNQPYWADSSNSEAIQSCYEDLKIFSNKATPKMIHQFENEYEGQIRIFNSDIEFVEFIQENQQNFAPAAQVIDNVNFNSPTQINVITPSKAALFNGVFQ